MDEIDSPAALAQELTAMFPEFASELEGEEIESYHQVVRLLTPFIAEYLQAAPKRIVEKFCRVVNDMVGAGKEKENAISTCLLEHASQVKVRSIIRPFLSPAAKRELR